MKRIFFLRGRFLLLIFVLSIWRAVASEPAVSTDEKNAPPLLVIYHTNDVHGHAFAEKSEAARWGYERLAAIVANDPAPRKMLLDAGDFLQGNAFAMLRQGELVARILTLLGYDAVAAGNHEFDYGVARFTELSARYRLPILSANVRKKADGETLLAPYTVKIFSDFKVGIFGLTTPMTAKSTDPRLIESLDFGDAESLFSDAAKIVAQLRDREQVDLVIALTHLGSENYCQPSSLQLADAVAGIDLIIDGHSHSEISDGIRVKNSLIVSTGAYLHNIGRIRIDRASVSGGEQFAPKFQIIAELLPASTSENSAAIDHNDYPEIHAAIAELQKIADEELKQTALNLPFRLEGTRAVVRTRETNFGKLGAAAMADAAKTSIAVFNSGAIRQSLAAGENTFKDFFSALPYDNKVLAITIDGQQLCDALNHGLSQSESGAYPQFYGMQIPRLAAAEKLTPEKIRLANGEQIDAAKKYEIAVTDFIYAGGDGYVLTQNFDRAAPRRIGEFREILRTFIATNSAEQLREFSKIPSAE